MRAHVEGFECSTFYYCDSYVPNKDWCCEYCHADLAGVTPARALTACARTALLGYALSHEELELTKTSTSIT